MPQEIFHITSAGSVDDGKSTILARLLLDTGSVFEDQLGGIDPRKVDATTIADLLDGLESEREQGITIDVAHRFFDSGNRRYHIADSPGHEQYTRNMATAASHADAMLLVVDARVGVKPQTVTHFGIARKFGISQFVVAVNKMDLVNYKQKFFADISSQIDELFEGDGVEALTIPVSGLAGDNVVGASKKMAWWKGPSVAEAFEAFAPIDRSNDDTVLSIQYVQRIAGGGRRYLASLHSGRLSDGDALISAKYPKKKLVIGTLANSGKFSSTVVAPAEVSFQLDRDVDLERGDVLSEADDVLYTDQFEADVVWLDDAGGVPGRNYLLRLAHQSVKATMTRVFTIETHGEKAGQVDHVDVNQTVRANIETHEKLSLRPFLDAPELGRLILVDLDSGNTVAVGTVNHTLRRADNLVAHAFDVSVEQRQALTGHLGAVAWFTGLSGSGKSTLVNEVSKQLAVQGVPHAVLDGDSLRLGLNKDLGFTEADRVENIRRAAEVAKLMADSGLVVLVSLISPYRADRERAAEIVGMARFYEVYVSTPIELCEQRDPKGLYQKARQGLIPNFTGIGSPYEEPENPHYVTNPGDSIEHETSRLMVALKRLWGL
jgi:bifunctional enzyme CysN/CysC